MKVVLPKALMKLIRPLPSIKLSTNSASKGSSFLRLDKLLNFDWQVAMGSNMVAPDEFFAMMENARGLIKFKGEYVYVNDDDLERLRKSFEAAKADGFRKYIMFLHYPPTNILERESGFTEMAEAYGAEQVIYAHSHGEHRFHDSIEGEKNGIHYHLVSGDYLQWVPKEILD